MNSIFIKAFMFILLNITFNVYSMDQKKDFPHQLATYKPEGAYSLSSPPMTAPTLIQTQTTNSHNINSPVADVSNTCNPVNTNVINFALIGAGLSKFADPSIYRGIWDKTKEWISGTASLMAANKKTTLSSFMGILYSGLNARLIYLNTKLSDSRCWSQWRSSLAIEELYLIPRQTLYNDLLTNIQTKYTNFRNFRDNLAPLSNFLEDAEQEEAYIKQYESIIKCLKAFHLHSIVFYSNTLYKQLSKRSSRLLFIKSAFLNWYAERKLNAPEKEALFRRFPRTKDILAGSTKEYSIKTDLIPPLLPAESTEFILENIIKI